MIYTLAKEYDYGPGMTEPDIAAAFERSLQLGIDYYLQEGIDGKRFVKARVISRRFRDGPPQGSGFRSRRMDARIDFTPALP